MYANAAASIVGDDADLISLLGRFRDASQGLLEARALLRRVDRKYLLPAAALPLLLERLGSEYQLLRSGGHAVAQYHTCYFDTGTLQMYEDHRRGKLPHHKVRIRQHVDRRVSFLEVKRKGSNGHTSKDRLALRYGQSELNPDMRAFVSQHSPLDGGSLHPALWIHFRRITLLGQRFDERITFDLNLEFSRHGRTERLPGVVVGEIKQARHFNNTPAILALHELLLREQSISKYCLATARLRQVRTSRFKAAFRAVNRLAS